MMLAAMGTIAVVMLANALAIWGVGKAVSLVYEGTKKDIDAKKRTAYRQELTRMAHIIKQKAPKPVQGLDPSTIEILMGAIGAGAGQGAEVPDAGGLGEPGAPGVVPMDTASLPMGLGEESFPGSVGEAGPSLGSDLASVLGMTQDDVRTAARPPATGMLALLGGRT